MAKKGVIVFSVILPEDFNFEDILLNDNYCTALSFDEYKTVELMYVSKNSNGTITGLFVTTQKKNIPPAHKPGGNDYTAIPLDDGQGLAYPNTILYDPKTSALYIETNGLGLNNKKIAAYFEQQATANGIIGLSIDIVPILRSEAYERVNKMINIESIDFQVAFPENILRKNLSQGALKKYAVLSQEMNATKTMRLVLKSEEVKGGLKMNEVLNMLRTFEQMQSEQLNKNDKLIIKGKRCSDEDDTTIVEDVVNYLMDKIKGSFVLDEPNIASHLQFTDRKNGITDVYLRKNLEVINVIGKYH